MTEIIVCHLYKDLLFCAVEGHNGHAFWENCKYFVSESAEFLDTKAGGTYANHIFRGFMSFLCHVRIINMKKYFSENLLKFQTSFI
jgi:hypothetical protein